MEGAGTLRGKDKKQELQMEEPKVRQKTQWKTDEESCHGRYESQDECEWEVWVTEARWRGRAVESKDEMREWKEEWRDGWMDRTSGMQRVSWGQADEDESPRDEWGMRRMGRRQGLGSSRRERGSLIPECVTLTPATDSILLATVRSNRIASRQQQSKWWNLFFWAFNGGENRAPVCCL